MKSQAHNIHLKNRISHNNCPECSADCERQFVAFRPFKYAHISEYLNWIKPRLEAIRNGDDSTNAKIWMRDFLRALHTRIGSHIPVAGRKQCHSYLERLGQFGANTDANYLRAFAKKGASAL